MEVKESLREFPPEGWSTNGIHSFVWREVFS